MNTIKTTVYISAIIFSISCAVEIDDKSKTSCSDVDFSSLESTVVNINGKYSLREYSIESIDNEMNLRFEELESEVIYNKYAVNVTMNTVQHVHFINAPASAYSWLNFFIRPAYSCVISSHYITETPITDIFILSNQDYDSTHLSGSSLNEYFRIFYRPERNIYKNSSINDLISLGENAQVEFTLYLDEPPEKDGFYSFIAFFELENGLEFEIEFSHDLVK